MLGQSLETSFCSIAHLVRLCPPRAQDVRNGRRLCLLLFVLLASCAHGPMRHLAAQEQDYIRLAQDQESWWFQDSAGHKFFSLGVNCIGGCYGQTEDSPLVPSRKHRIISQLRAWGFNTA